MDNITECNVWQRVYGAPQTPQRLTPRQRQELRRCLERANANLRFYESQRRNPTYPEAFAHLALQTAEHIKMMRQMLSD